MAPPHYISCVFMLHLLRHRAMANSYWKSPVINLCLMTAQNVIQHEIAFMNSIFAYVHCLPQYVIRVYPQQFCNSAVFEWLGSPAHSCIFKEIKMC